MSICSNQEQHYSENNIFHLDDIDHPIDLNDKGPQNLFGENENQNSKEYEQIPFNIQEKINKKNNFKNTCFKPFYPRKRGLPSTFGKKKDSGPSIDIHINSTNDCYDGCDFPSPTSLTRQTAITCTPPTKKPRIDSRNPTSPVFPVSPVFTFTIPPKKVEMDLLEEDFKPLSLDDDKPHVVSPQPILSFTVNLHQEFSKKYAWKHCEIPEFFNFRFAFPPMSGFKNGYQKLHNDIIKCNSWNDFYYVCLSHTHNANNFATIMDHMYTRDHHPSLFEQECVQMIQYLDRLLNTISIPTCTLNPWYILYRIRELCNNPNRIFVPVCSPNVSEMNLKLVKCLKDINIDISSHIFEDIKCPDFSNFKINNDFLLKENEEDKRKENALQRLSLKLDDIIKDEKNHRLQSNSSDTSSVQSTTSSAFNRSTHETYTDKKIRYLYNMIKENENFNLENANELWTECYNDHIPTFFKNIQSKVKNKNNKYKYSVDFQLYLLYAFPVQFLKVSWPVSFEEVCNTYNEFNIHHGHNGKAEYVLYKLVQLKIQDDPSLKSLLSFVPHFPCQKTFYLIRRHWKFFCEYKKITYIP